MRISMDRADPGYTETIDHGINAIWLDVWLDDVKMVGIVTADDVQGLVVRYARGPDDKLLFTPGDRTPRLETLRGVVEIRLRHRSDGTWPHDPGLWTRWPSPALLNATPFSVTRGA